MVISLELVSHNLCPYVQRAAIALAEKGVPFVRTTISLDAKPDWFNGDLAARQIPLLRVSGPDGAETVLFESNAICEWIDETQSGPTFAPARSA